VLKINNKLKNLAISILIGGKSTRFGSDKGLFEFQGKPLISYQLETLTQKDYHIFLVANSKKQVSNYIKKIDIATIMAFIVDDNIILSNTNIRNPMIGLYSAFSELDKLGYKKTLALSCDMPFIKLNVVDFLIEKSKGYDCCIPRWDKGFLEPLFAIYPVRKARLMAKKNLEKKFYKLSNLLDKNWKIKYISVENLIQPLDKDLCSFININEPAELDNLTNC
jgi:molybdopterin-guanine dinucleotide biosynthesis protein A